MPMPTPPQPGEEPTNESELYRYHLRRLITWYLEALDPLPAEAFDWRPPGVETNALAAIGERAPDVVVSDIGMPGADGYELLRQVRELGEERGGKLRAIALTAFARTEDRTRALRAGFLAHVAKPVDPSELVATIATVAGRTA